MALKGPEMTAHDPRVTLTDAEITELARTWFEIDRQTLYGNVGHWDEDDERHAYLTAAARVAPAIADLIAARLAPIRALADEWEAAGFEIEPAQVRAALDDPVSASQDHAWHQPLTHCHCGRVIPCRHHDGAEGQGEGERAGERCSCVPDGWYVVNPVYMTELKRLEAEHD